MHASTAGPRLSPLFPQQADGLAVVSSFVLTPYTSFWQPEQPTYNPEEAFFQLTHPQINGGKKPYYESPRYRVNGSMKVRLRQNGRARVCVFTCVAGVRQQQIKY